MLVFIHNVSHLESGSNDIVFPHTYVVVMLKTETVVSMVGVCNLFINNHEVHKWPQSVVLVCDSR